MKRYNILITSIGSTTSIGVVKCIRKSSAADALIVGTDINEKKIAGSGLVDKFYQVNAFDHPDYLLSLKRIVIENSIEIIIPIHDHEIGVLALAIDQFAELNCKVIVSSSSTICVVNNKYKFARQLDYSDILNPNTFRVEEWLNLAQTHAFKWLLKPIEGVSSRGIHVGTSGEIEEVLKKRIIDEDRYVIQKFIEGIEYTVDVFVKDKKTFCVVPRVRIEVRDGLCYKASTERNNEFIGITDQIISLFDFYGPINIQFIKEKISGKIYCIECNPRFGGSSVITLYAGINLFDLILTDYEKEPLKYQNDYKQIYMNRYWEEFYYEK